MNDTPKQAFTGVEYQGYNTLFLNNARTEKNYSTNEWASFLDWKKNGYNVIKGEHGIHCRTFIKDEIKTGVAIRYFVLFNRAQVETTKTKEVSPLEFLHDHFIMATVKN